MYKSSISKKQERIAITGWIALWAIIAFVAIFFLTQITLSEWDKAREYQKAHGLETLNVTPPHVSVGLGLQIPVNAQSHISVEDYIIQVKGEICPMLDNLTYSNVTTEECNAL